MFFLTRQLIDQLVVYIAPPSKFELELIHFFAASLICWSHTCHWTQLFFSFAPCFKACGHNHLIIVSIFIVSQSALYYCRKISYFFWWICWSSFTSFVPSQTLHRFLLFKKLISSAVCCAMPVCCTCFVNSIHLLKRDQSARTHFYLFVCLAFRYKFWLTWLFWTKISFLLILWWSLRNYHSLTHMHSLSLSLRITTAVVVYIIVILLSNHKLNFSPFHTERRR